MKGLEDIGVKFDDRGLLDLKDGIQTSVSNIYAVGVI
jgi:pyruvate/2-oxoglutarate dehydrogenase complex dihydrolipoamide dehydrogenase (E3) component